MVILGLILGQSCISQKWMSNALVKLQREGVIKKLGTSKDARYRTLKAS